MIGTQLVALLAACTAVANVATSQALQQPWSQGDIVGAGTPLASVNLFPLLYYYIPASGQPGNRSVALSRLSSACSRGFTFLRISGSLFWPSEMSAGYVADPSGCVPPLVLGGEETLVLPG